MSKRGYIFQALLLLILGVAFSVPTYADAYEITFTADSGTAPNTGTFTYNGTNFTSFSVTWSSGASIDLAELEVDLTANHWTDEEYFDAAFAASGTLDWSSGGDSLFSLDDEYNNIAFDATNGFSIPDGSGTYVVTDETVTPTPEPSSALLFGTGLLGMIGTVWRRRLLAHLV